VLKIQTQCRSLLDKDIVSVREMTQLIGRLSSTALAILPAPLQYRYLQKATDQRVTNFRLIRKEHNYFRESKIRDSVVDSEPGIKQRKIFDLEASSTCNSIGCLKERLGGLVKGKEQGSLDFREKQAPYKYIGNESSKTSYINIYKKQEVSKQHSHSNGQYGGSVLPSKNGMWKQITSQGMWRTPANGN